jgi:hypothetical protein
LRSRGGTAHTPELHSNPAIIHSKGRRGANSLAKAYPNLD